MSPITLPSDFPKLQGKSNFAAWTRSFKIYAKEYQNIYEGAEKKTSSPDRPDIEDYILKICQWTDNSNVFSPYHTNSADSMLARVQMYEVLRKEHDLNCERFTQARILLWQSLSPAIQSVIPINVDNVEAFELMSKIKSIYQPNEDVDMQNGKTLPTFDTRFIDQYAGALDTLQLKDFVNIADLYAEIQLLSKRIENLGGERATDDGIRNVLFFALPSEYDSFTAAYRVDKSREYQSVDSLVEDLKQHEAWLKACPRFGH